MKKYFIAIVLMFFIIAFANAQEGWLKFESKFGSKGKENGQFEHPESIAIDKSGNIYVLDGWGVQKFDPSGKFLIKIENYSSSAIALDNQNNLYVVELGGGNPDNKEFPIKKYDPSGKLVLQFGKMGDRFKKFKDGEISFPLSIGVDPSGNIYVLDTELEHYEVRIQKFDPSGKLLNKFGSKGEGDGQFSLSYNGSIAVDDSGNVYVADELNGRIQKFDPSGKLLLKINNTTMYSNSGMPTDSVSLDKYGNVFVLSRFDGTIRKYDPFGKLLNEFITAKVPDVEHLDIDSNRVGNGIAIDGTGNIYIVDSGNNNIKKFSQNEAVSQGSSKETSLANSSGDNLIPVSFWGRLMNFFKNLFSFK